MNKEYEAVISSETAKINAFLGSCAQLESSDGSHWETVLEAEKYALSAGGKRIRPLLAVEFYKLFSGTDSAPDFVYEAAVTLEMTHTFSLIHDDMPEMDDDDLRRGKPATHVKFGTATGLLAGDGLAILPYEILADMALGGRLDPLTAVKLTKLLSANAGNRGMIAGQMLDLWSEERADAVNEDFLKEMSGFKTGCLLTASCLFGAVLAGADDERCRSAEIYAKKVGLAFQIVDDVLDVTSSPEELGKPTGSDSGREKPTFYDILGEDGALREAERLSAEAAAELEKYPGSGLLREFALSLAKRKK